MKNKTHLFLLPLFSLCLLNANNSNRVIIKEKENAPDSTLSVLDCEGSGGSSTSTGSTDTSSSSTTDENKYNSIDNKIRTFVEKGDILRIDPTNKISMITEDHYGWVDDAIIELTEYDGIGIVTDVTDGVVTTIEAEPSDDGIGVKCHYYDAKKLKGSTVTFSRVRGVTDEQRTLAVYYCQCQLGKPYKLWAWEFNDSEEGRNYVVNDEFWYGSELVLAAYQYAGKKLTEDHDGFVRSAEIFDSTALITATFGTNAVSYINKNEHWIYFNGKLVWCESHRTTDKCKCKVCMPKC